MHLMAFMKHTLLVSHVLMLAPATLSITAKPSIALPPHASLVRHLSTTRLTRRAPVIFAELHNWSPEPSSRHRFLEP
jgi:hypothetical protein